MLAFTLLVFPIVNADVMTPTVSHVYFEQNNQAYTGHIEFTVKGYGYSYSPGPPLEKEQGTYTPEDVFSFTGVYNNYGDQIYESYYKNYRHIDYYELEGKDEDGKTFVIKNMQEIPTNCKWLDEIDEPQNYDPERMIQQVCELRFNLDNAQWDENIVSEPTGFWAKISCFFKMLFGKSC